MNDAVSHALVTRPREPDGWFATLGASLLAHAALVGVVALAGTLPSPVEPLERDVMTISLGGSPGPRSGGMSPLGGRPIQEVAPSAPKPRPEPATPPAPRPPAMTVPVKEPRPTPKPATPPKSAPTEATGRTPTKGADVRPGNALIETGARGIGLGLSTGGGGGTGGEIDLGSFCCPEYLTTLIDLVQRNWNSKQQVSGAATVKFTIARDGTISDVEVARSSGYAVLDLTAQRAILSTRLPPLPRAYTNPDLTVHLNFQYQH